MSVPAQQISTAEAFALSEASVRLEGIDPNDDPRYIALKERVLAGEISSSEAVTLLLAPYAAAHTNAA
jgi:hypothetical protein